MWFVQSGVYDKYIINTHTHTPQILNCDYVPKEKI